MSRARDRRKAAERINRWPQLQPRLIGTLADLVKAPPYFLDAARTHYEDIARKTHQ